MHERLIQWSRQSSTLIERILAAFIIVGVAIFGWESVELFWTLDWQDSETFYELIYRVLLMVIGVELARTMLTHNLNAILELLAFVVARKMMKPDITSLDILLSVLAFVILLAGKFYWLGATTSTPPASAPASPRTSPSGNG
ncbi:MAG TPA: hypothetical protein PKE55_02120 [Kiritimatiellia bacterium]|nr:hypothetical protein [Kiritimatiellia bacterium]